MDILEIQTALNKHGFSPGDLDGVWGRRTMLAVKAFQKARGLTPDGIVGPLTLRTLAGSDGAAAARPADAMPLPWLEEAVRLIGTREIPGRRSNQVILEWAENLNIDFNNDDIPWCGLFVGHCIGATLPDEELPTGLLRARSWRGFGERCEPKRGAVLVFWRVSQQGLFGHVGFYYSQDQQSYHVLGGNQSNQVNVARVGKNRLLAARWPRTAALLSGAVVEAEGQGPLSHNEA